MLPKLSSWLNGTHTHTCGLPGHRYKLILAHTPLLFMDPGNVPLPTSSKTKHAAEVR